MLSSYPSGWANTDVTKAGPWARVKIGEEYLQLKGLGILIRVMEQGRDGPRLLPPLLKLRTGWVRKPVDIPEGTLFRRFQM